MRTLFLATIALLFLPGVAFADGVSPVLNLFHRDTWPQATIITVAIILVESLLLFWRIRQVSLSKTLWRSFLLNLASSIAGSVLLVGLGRDSFFMDDSLELVIPLFFITVLVEIPLLHWLYRDQILGWERAVALGFGINLASYAVVFVLEIVFVIGWFNFASRADEREKREWNHPELLTQFSGNIYATRFGSAHTGLWVFNAPHNTWQALSNCPPMNTRVWDIQGNMLAFISLTNAGSTKPTVTIASLPAFATLHQINLAPLMPPTAATNSSWRQPVKMALSADGDKLAVLFPVADAVAYCDEYSHYSLGSKCKLAVFAVETGRLLAQSGRWGADEALCWFPDSDRVLFSSYEDATLFDTTPDQVRGQRVYSACLAHGNRFKQQLYSLGTKDGSVQAFGSGSSPQLNRKTRQLCVQEGDQIRFLDPEGRELHRLVLARLRYPGVAVSPDGNFLLACQWPHAPLSRRQLLTVLPIVTPARRHILNNPEDSLERFQWIESASPTDSRP